MGRWTQYDEDDYRLPEGMKRVGYDADTGRYTFVGNGRFWQGEPGSYYGHMTPMRASTSAVGPRHYVPDVGIVEDVPPQFPETLPSESRTAGKSHKRAATLPSMPQSSSLKATRLKTPMRVSTSAVGPRHCIVEDEVPQFPEALPSDSRTAGTSHKRAATLPQLPSRIANLVRKATRPKLLGVVRGMFKRSKAEEIPKETMSPTTSEAKEIEVTMSPTTSEAKEIEVESPVAQVASVSPFSMEPEVKPAPTFSEDKEPLPAGPVGDVEASDDTVEADEAHGS